MTALVVRFPPAIGAFFEALAIAAGLAFLLLVAGPAARWASDESFVTTSALEISAAWRASAFPVGVLLMAAFSLLRLGMRGHYRQTLLALALVAAVVAGFWLAGPVLKPLGNYNLIIFFVVNCRTMRLYWRAHSLFLRSSHVRLSGFDHPGPRRHPGGPDG